MTAATNVIVLEKKNDGIRRIGDMSKSKRFGFDSMKDYWASKETTKKHHPSTKELYF